MAKQTRKPKKPPESSSEEVDSASDDLVATGKSILRAALEDLRTALSSLGDSLREKAKKKNAVHDRDGWSHHAWVTNQVAGIMDKVRKIEATDRNVAKNISPALIMAFFRNLDAETRQRLIRQVVALDDDGSVLG